MAKSSFSQLGGDSLSAMHLSSLLREHLSLELPVDVILQKPLEDILSSSGVAGGEGKSSGAQAMCHDWVKEASLESVQESSLLDVPDVSSCVLLTGCTGFLGRFILWELLKDARITRIFCLAQNKNGKTIDTMVKLYHHNCNIIIFPETNAEERIMTILHQLQQEFNCDHILGLEKLVVVVGDLSKPKLGLSMDDYDTLCQEVDTIVHNGAIVNSVLPYLGK